MVDIWGIKISKKKRIVLICILFLILATIVTARVVATSTIKILWSYKNVDQNYIVCCIEDTEYGISMITNLDGTKQFNVDLDIDDQIGGQITPLTIKYPLENGETSFKVWNTDDKYKIVKMNEIGLNITNASTNSDGNVLSINAINEDGDITKLEYMNGDTIETYNDKQEIFTSIQLASIDTRQIKVFTSKGTYPVIVNLDNDTIPPQPVYVYKNNNGKIALTAQSSSGIWQITDINGEVIVEATKFETYKTVLFETTEFSVLIKNGVGTTTEVIIPTEACEDEGVVASVTYEEDAFVINASNNSLGLWKITNSQDDSLIYQFADEPNSATYSVLRELNILGVRIYDMAGNFKTLIFDKTPPRICWAYRDTTANEVEVCIEDTDSGLKYVKDNNGKRIYTFSDQEQKAVFSCRIKDGVNSLYAYDCENNMSTLNFDDIKFNVANAYKNIDGDRISIVASIDDPNDSTNFISKITYIDEEVIDIVNAKSVDKCYELEHDGTVKINVYDKNGDYIVIVLDYEEDDEPEIAKCLKSETKDKVLVKATDTESGLSKITYTDGRLIKRFPTYVKTIDDVYSVENNTESILIWDRIGNVNQVDFTNNTSDESGPELVDDIQYDSNGDDYTVTLRDIKAGLSKITNYTTGEVLYDFANDGYPADGTYSGKISTDGTDIRVYDRLGNVTNIAIDETGPYVISCVPRGNHTTDWTIVAKDEGTGLAKLTYENGNLICNIPNSTAQQSIDFSVTKGTDAVLVVDRIGNSTRVELDNTIPELLAVCETDQEDVFTIIAKDRGIGLKSVRATPNGEDLGVFSGDTRLQENVDIVLPETVEKLYVVDLADNVSEPYELEEEGGEIILIGGGTIITTDGGIVIGNKDDDDDGIIDIKLYNDTGKDIIVNKDDEGNIGPNPGITIQEGTTVRLLLGNEDAYVYGGYVGSGARQTDANYIHYPGISVPEGAKLIIQNRAQGGTGTLYVYGNATTDYGVGDGSAAGIGGYGVVAAKANEKAIAQSSGEIEIVSGNVVAVSLADKNAYGTGAGIGGGGACAWNGTASAGLGNKNNIIVHNAANVTATTNGQKGVGATIGGGGKYDKTNRQGSSGGVTIVDYQELPMVKVTHTPTEETHGDVTLKVTVKAKQGLYKVSLDDDLQEILFRDCPSEETTCEFKVDENRTYRITATDMDGLTNTVRYTVDNISTIIDDNNPTGDNNGDNNGNNNGDNNGNNNGDNNGNNNGDNSGNNNGDNNGDNNGNNNGDNNGDNNGNNNDNNQEQSNPPVVMVSTSSNKGIKINNDCTIVFDNDEDIIINKDYKTNDNGMAGIEIKDGVNVKILQIGQGNVAIYGGHNKDLISYPGIMVQEHSTLEIQGVTNAKLYAFGYGMVSDEENIIIGGSGAGIGGYGEYSRTENAKGQDCGSVNIISGNIEAYGGTIELRDGTSQASGAGIGGGGAYSVLGMATSGKVKGTISNKGANIVAIGGISNRSKGANIGNGGAATVEGVNINGQEVTMITDYIEITKDTLVRETCRKGYRITRDCKLTFENTHDIIIGSTRMGTAGISVADGVQAEISIEGSGNVKIYGGYAGRGNKEDGYFVMYPSIEVPKNSRLTINNKTAQSLTLYGGGVDEIPVSASGIGTCGVYSSGKSAISNDVGRVIINGGTVNIIPKQVAYCGQVGAVGAAIGSGGAASNNKDAIVKVGKLKDNNVEIADIANVVIRADKSTKIGNGSMLCQRNIVKGEEARYVIIDTLAPQAEIGRIDDGRYAYAQIKVGARDETSRLSRVELEDGTVYRFPKYHQKLSALYFKWYKNGTINAKVYDEAGNFRRVSLDVSGIDEQKSSADLIKIDVDNSIVRNINNGEYVTVSFKAQPKNVNMYVRIDDKEERLVHKGNDAFSYNLQVFDNCVVTARMEDVATLRTVWEEKQEVSNLVRVTTDTVLSKTSNSANIQCLLQELYNEDYKVCDIRKIGVYYSAVGGNSKVLNISHGNVLNDAILGDTYLKYNFKLNRLKANTKYRVQTYIVNSLGQEILSPEIYFRTRPNGGGITTRYYEVANIIPSLIKQFKEANLTLQWGTIEPIRNKYGDIIINGVAKGKMECIGQIVPINSRSIWFKVDSNKDAVIEIGQERLEISKGENYINTKNIYLEGEKYPFRMMLKDDTAGGVDVKVYWLEDGKYQEIVPSQFYPKEYVKIESAIVDKNDKLQQEIDKDTGKPINKKVLSNGMQVKKLDMKNTKVVLASGVILKEGIQAEVEGNIILKEEGAILPIVDNVWLIDYEDKVLVLSDGTRLGLYKDVDVIGNVRDKRNNKIYDLCKYIQSIDGSRITMVDGTQLTLGTDVKSIDNNYVRDLYRNDYETPEYQELMNKYATMERLVYEMSTSNLSDLGVGEGRLFEVLPIKILLSFDADENFVIRDPVIEINGNLTDDREGNVGNNLKLGFPGDITKRGYASWKYMNNEKGGYFTEGDMSNYATIDRMKNGNFKVTLNGYSKKYGVMSKDIDNNIMLNLLLQVETSDNVTKEEILQKIARAQNSYTAYTNVKIKEITLEKKQTKMDVLDTVLPIKIRN